MSRYSMVHPLGRVGRLSSLASLPPNMGLHVIMHLEILKAHQNGIQSKRLNFWPPYDILNPEDSLNHTFATKNYGLFSDQAKRLYCLDINICLGKPAYRA